MRGSATDERATAPIALLIRPALFGRILLLSLWRLSPVPRTDKAGECALWLMPKRIVL